MWVRVSGTTVGAHQSKRPVLRRGNQHSHYNLHNSFPQSVYFGLSWQKLAHGNWTSRWNTCSFNLFLLSINLLPLLDFLIDSKYLHKYISLLPSPSPYKSLPQVVADRLCVMWVRVSGTTVGAHQSKRPVLRRGNQHSHYNLHNSFPQSVYFGLSWQKLAHGNWTSRWNTCSFNLFLLSINLLPLLDFLIDSKYLHKYISLLPSPSPYKSLPQVVVNWKHKIRNFFVL